MKILISPAKSLDYSSSLPVTEVTQPMFSKQAKIINKVLKELSPSELSDLMKISPKLAELNWSRNQERSFVSELDPAKARQAVYAFNGDVYAGLDAYSLPENKIEAMQDSLRILSGLYGILKPLDVVEPYRLEMGTKMAVGESANLYAFWKPILSDALNAEMQQNELLVNLASTEYFSAIDKKALNATLVTPVFKELREGKLKIISFFAKKARGMMARYIIEQNIQSLEELKGFNIDGYCFSEAESKKDTLVFTR